MKKVLSTGNLPFRRLREDMCIGGLQKSSLIDYPGKISCVLFLTGCNFKCPYCHNPALVPFKKGAALLPLSEQLDRFFISRRSFLDGVVISGGEPTLHPQLAELCEHIKAYNYPVKLDTNGSHPEVIRNLLKYGLVDYVAMDIKTDPTAYRPLTRAAVPPDRIYQSIRIIMESAPAYEFRTTCVKPFIDEKVIETIGDLIRGADHYVLQRLQTGVALSPEFFRAADRACSEGDLHLFQTLAASNVSHCTVR